MRNNIKVLHIIASLGNGGAERQLIEILKCNRSHGVLLLTEADVYKETLDKLNIKYYMTCFLFYFIILVLKLQL